MCGISGILSKNDYDKNLKSRIDLMIENLNHRGPDFKETIVDNNFNIALGHSRLKIIDLSAKANQPMICNENRFILTFNGEIYNFKEIKACLNYNFQSNSDSEVIIASVKLKGIDWFLNIANGMFAFAIFDKKEDKLILARDRFGIKPLYYFKEKETMVFSSETSSIFASGLVKREVRRESLNEYLAYRHIRAPYSFFENVFQVLPAEYIVFQGNKTHKVKYWDLPSEFNNSEDFDEKIVLEEFENLINKSIELRTLSDVTLGSYLSGGVDSSLITSILSKKNELLNTYSIGFEENNEFEFSNLVANKLKTNHHEIKISKKEYFDLWYDLISKKNAPLGVPNEVPLYKMSEVLKNKITVVLSGEGADELCGGYGRIFRTDLEYKKNKSKQSFIDFFISKYEYIPNYQRGLLLGNNLAINNTYDHDIKFNSNLEFIFRFFYKNHIGGLLERLDFTTMMWGVEARVPFLDHKLVEYSFKNIPSSIKLKWKSEKAKEKASLLSPEIYSENLDIPKYPIRKIAYKYLPKKIIERKKVGFPVPLDSWKIDLNNKSEEILKDSSIIDFKNVKKQLNNGLDYQGLWMLINLEQFYRNQQKNKLW